MYDVDDVGDVGDVVDVDLEIIPGKFPSRKCAADEEADWCIHFYACAAT